MLINRGNQDNGIFMWDESADKFTLGLTTADGSSTGNIALNSLGTLVANLEGNVTGTIQTAAQPNITSIGTLTTLTVDDITIDGSVISDSGTLTIDAGSDLKLDADSSNIYLADGGSDIALLSTNNQDLNIRNLISDKDIYFQGKDGTSTITALSLDMSDAGTAIFNHDVKLGDNSKAIFGASDDLQIYHDQPNSINYIKSFTSNELRLESNGNTTIRTNNGDDMAVFTKNGAATLYYDNNPKLATTSTGIDVTGVITTDGLTTSADINFGDNDKAMFGASDDLQIYHDGTSSYIVNTTNDLVIQDDTRIRLRTPSLLVNNASDTENMLTATENGAVTLYYDNSAKIATTSTGIDVTGTATMDGLTVDGDAIIQDATPTLEFKDTDNNLIASVGGASGSLLLKADTGSGTSGESMQFHTGGSQRVTIDASGNVGIGISSPSAKLHVVETNTNTIVGKIKSSTSASYLSFEDNSTTAGQVRVGAIGNEFVINAGGATAVRIDSNQNVGIGTTSPSYKLHTSGSDAIQAWFQSTHADTCQIQLSTATTNSFARITNNAGTLIYESDITGDNASSGHQFKVDGSERMRIDSSGHMFVGSSSYTGNTTGSGSGFYNAGDGMICFASGQSTPAIFNRTSADGKVIEIRRDGTTVGSIGANGSYPYIGSHGTSGKGLKITDALLPATNSGGFNDADVNLGASNVRWKDLYLSGTAYVATSVGIGTSSPSKKLHVYNTASADVALLESTQVFSTLAFKSSTNASTVTIGIDGAGNASFENKLSSGNMTFVTNGSERMRIDSSGRLMVGQTSAYAPSGSGVSMGTFQESSDSRTNLVVSNQNSGSSAGSSIVLASHGSDYIIENQGSGKGGALTFTRGTTEHVRLDSSGKVGIGTASGTGSLHVTTKDSNGSDVYYVAQNTTSNRLAGYKIFDESGNTGGVFQYDNGGNALNIGTAINTHFSFNTNNTERMRIDTSGNLLVGATSFGYSGSQDAIQLGGGEGRIDIENNTTSTQYVVSFYNPNGNVGKITTSGSSTNYDTSSDYRLKENVDYDFNALDRVTQLKPARFNFIADEDTTVDGFLAHEVQDIVPEAITGEKDAVDDEGNPEYQGIDQSKLVPLLTKAIQEQQEQIEALQSEINKLKGE
jgi:hypothetical protein